MKHLLNEGLKSPWPVLASALLILSACTAIATDYGGRTTLLTDATGWYSEPLWSPDGTLISFSDFEGNETIMNLDSGTLTTMALGRPEPVERIGPTVWYEPDAIGYGGWSRSAAGSWFVTSDLQGDAEVVFGTEASILKLCWNSGAQKFIMSLGAPGDIYGTWLQEYDPELGRLQAYLGRLYQVEENEVITSIDCHPLRDEIAVAIRSDARPMRVERMSLGAAEREVLFEAESGVDLDELSFSPDGEWLAVRTVAGSSSRLRRGIMLLSTTGEDPIQLDLPWRREGVVDLAWSPTSNQLLVRLIHRVGHYSLHLLDVSPWLEE